MKKIYQTPATIIVKVRPSTMMAVSGFNATLDNNFNGDGEDALVKERSDYSVWNDDWSE